MQRICNAFILIAIPLFGISHFNYAQNTSSGIEIYDQYKTYVSNIISPLDKSQIPTGFLHEFGYPAFHPSQLLGTRLDSNQISPTQWQTIYSSLQSMHLQGANSLPTLNSVQAQLKNYTNNTNNVIALSVLSAKYASIKENAITNNLLYQQNNQLYDVLGRTANPYQAQEAFVVAPVLSEIEGLETSFSFRNDLLYSNYGLLPQHIQTLQIDANNGQGWQNVVWNTPLQVQYPNEGLKILKYKITFSNGNVREGHSFLEVKNLPKADLQRYSTFWDEEIRHSNGIAYIVYSSQNPQKRMRKPLIVAEGFDQSYIAPLIKKKNYDLAKFLKQIDVKITPTQTLDGLIDDIGGYDLVFLDYKDGTADITGVNVPFFQYVLREVKRQKELNTQQTGATTFKNVVLGLSMGGLISRYGLAQYARGTGFERAVSEDTRLLITYDSPHRGANIPLGFQGLMRQFASVFVFPGISLTSQGDGGKKIQQAIAVFDSPAFRQLVLYRATSPTGLRKTGGNWLGLGATYELDTEYNTFISQVYQPMVHDVPNQPYEFVAVSMGSECSIPNANGNDTFLDGGFWEAGGPPDVSLHFTPTVKASPNNNPNSTNTLAKLVVKRRTFAWMSVFSIFGLIPMLVDEITPIYNQSFVAPPNLLFLDGAPGGTLLSKDAFPPQNGLGYPTRQFCFVPQASALDVPLSAESMFSTKYVLNYFKPNTPTNVKRYITQEPTVNPDPQFTDGVVSPNLEHDQNPSPRLGLWMFRQMEGIATNDLICNRPCLPTAVIDPLTNAPNLLCVNTPKTFNISVLHPSLPYTFTVATSANILSSVSGNNITLTARPSIPTKPNSIGTQGTVRIDVTLMIGDCPYSFSFEKTIFIGKPKQPQILNGYGGATFTDGQVRIIPQGGMYIFSVDINNGYSPDTYVEWDTNLEISEYNTPNTNSILVNVPTTPNTYGYARARLINECGTTEWIMAIILTGQGGGGSNPSFGRSANTVKPLTNANIIAFPNPFIGNDFQIKIDGLQGVDYTKVTDQTLAGFDYNVRIQDDKGQILQTLKDNKVITKINMRGYQQGIYYAHIEADGVIKTIRVSKQ